MYHCSDPSYIQSIAIKCGEYQLNTQEMAMTDWLTKFIGIRPLNFYFETVETTKGYRQQHIFIILERESECAIAQKSANEEMIIKTFQGYFDEYGPSKTDQLKAEIFPRVDSVYPETTVAYRPLEEIELAIAYELADDDIKQIAPRFSEIWTISTNMTWRDVFYHTDEQLAANMLNGTNESIKAAVLQAIKKYDRFGYFGQHSLRVNFDSKESFDRDYSGNWYYYYK